MEQEILHCAANVDFFTLAWPKKPKPINLNFPVHFLMFNHGINIIKNRNSSISYMGIDFHIIIFYNLKPYFNEIPILPMFIPFIISPYLSFPPCQRFFPFPTFSHRLFSHLLFLSQPIFASAFFIV